MKKRFIFALALMAAMFLGGLICEGTTLAQNSNSSTTMGNMNSSSMRGRRRHRRGYRRRHRRGTRMPKNSNT